MFTIVYFNLIALILTVRIVLFVDRYVKVYLLPDKTKGGKRKTKTKKNTLTPDFDEILTERSVSFWLERKWLASRKCYMSSHGKFKSNTTVMWEVGIEIRSSRAQVPL